MRNCQDCKSSEQGSLASISSIPSEALENIIKQERYKNLPANDQLILKYREYVFHQKHLARIKGLVHF